MSERNAVRALSASECARVSGGRFIIPRSGGPVRPIPAPHTPPMPISNPPGGGGGFSGGGLLPPPGPVDRNGDPLPVDRE